MLTYTNIKHHTVTNFEQYLSIDGYSHSWIKAQRNGVQQPFNASAKVHIGKIVDQIITRQKVDFASEYYPQAKPIAEYLTKNFGAMLQHMKTQVAITADIEYSTPHGTLIMPTKGVLDFLVPKVLVNDLKVTWEKNVDALIEFMGYKNQLWHYSRLAQVNEAYITAYSVPLKKGVVKKIDVTGMDENCSAYSFWLDAVMNFGRVK